MAFPVSTYMTDKIHSYTLKDLDTTLINDQHNSPSGGKFLVRFLTLCTLVYAEKIDSQGSIPCTQLLSGSCI